MQFTISPHPPLKASLREVFLWNRYKKTPLFNGVFIFFNLFDEFLFKYVFAEDDFSTLFNLSETYDFSYSSPFNAKLVVVLTCLMIGISFNWIVVLSSQKERMVLAALEQSISASSFVRIFLPNFYSANLLFPSILILSNSASILAS